MKAFHCMKSARIQSFYGPYFPSFWLNPNTDTSYSVRMRENTDQKNSKYGLFSDSGWTEYKICCVTGFKEHYLCPARPTHSGY